MNIAPDTLARMEWSVAAEALERAQRMLGGPSWLGPIIAIANERATEPSGKDVSNEWLTCERIAKSPAVTEMISSHLTDPTPETAVMLVREIYRHMGARRDHLATAHRRIANQRKALREYQRHVGYLGAARQRANGLAWALWSILNGADVQPGSVLRNRLALVLAGFDAEARRFRDQPGDDE